MGEVVIFKHLSLCAPRALVGKSFVFERVVGKSCPISQPSTYGGAAGWRARLDTFWTWRRFQSRRQFVQGARTWSSLSSSSSLSLPPPLPPSWELLGELRPPLPLVLLTQR